MACSILVTARYVQRRNNSKFTHSETTVSVRHQSRWQFIGNVRVRVGLLGILPNIWGESERNGVSLVQLSFRWLPFRNTPHGKNAQRNDVRNI